MNWGLQIVGECQFYRKVIDFSKHIIDKLFTWMIVYVGVTWLREYNSVDKDCSQSEDWVWDSWSWERRGIIHNLDTHLGGYIGL